MDRSRFQVEVAYLLPAKDALVDDLAAAGIPAHCLGTGRRFDLSWIRRLRQLVRERGYDIVHTHSPVSAAVARLCTWPDRPRLVHTEHNMWRRYRWPTYAANLLTYALNDHVIAVSDAVADSIQQGRVPHLRAMPPIEVVVHGIDLGARPGSDARAKGRGLLGLPEDQPVVGTVGNLTPKKDHITLLRALRLLRADHGQVRLVVVGTGPLRRELEQAARSLGVEDLVQFAGMRDDVADLLPAFDVFVLSSRFEGLSIALVEALAAGVPAVATAVGGIPEVISDGAEGMLVPAESPEAIAAAVGQVLSDDELRRDMSRAALQRARAFDIRHAVGRIEQIYATA